MIMQRKGHGSQNQRVSGHSANTRGAPMLRKQKMDIAAQTTERDIIAGAVNGRMKKLESSYTRTQEKVSIIFRL